MGRKVNQKEGRQFRVKFWMEGEEWKAMLKTSSRTFPWFLSDMKKIALHIRAYWRLVFLVGTEEDSVD